MSSGTRFTVWTSSTEHQIAFPSYSSCEDRLFNIAYYRHAQKVVTTSEVLYQYAFEGKSSLTNKYFDNKFETFLEFYNELLDLTDKDLGGFSALFLKGTMSCIIPLHGASCPLDWVHQAKKPTSNTAAPACAVRNGPQPD